MHAAHIKRNTQGTSNEISFSVLDAAKNALDEGRDRPTEQARWFGRINLFTLPLGRKKPPSTPKKDERMALLGGSSSATHIPLGMRSASKSIEDAKSSSSTDSPAAASSLSDSIPKSIPFERAPRSSGRTSQEEIAWRKGRRRRSRIIAGTTTAVIVAALVVAGVWFLYDDTMRYQQNTEQLRFSAEKLGSTDELLLALDDSLSDPMGDKAGEFSLERRDDVRQAMTALDEAESTASQAMQGLRETREREAADALMMGSSARKTMFEKGMEILAAAQATAQPYEQLVKAWQQVVEADDAARDAASLAAQGSQDVIARSSDLSRQAMDLFQQSYTAIESLSQQNTDVDLDEYLSYIDKRIEALGYAIASNDALLERDTAKAVQQNDAYNQADRDAAEIAASFPTDPGQPFLDALESDTADQVESYEAARSQASSSDAFLRDYLGSSAK